MKSSKVNENKSKLNNCAKPFATLDIETIKDIDSGSTGQIPFVVTITHDYHTVLFKNLNLNKLWSEVFNYLII